MITTSTGAKKLESSDNWREIFPNPGTSAAGAHNASVDAQDRIQAEVAPIINGKRCSLGAASGEYVLLRNSTIAGKTDGAYKATKAIPADTDLDSTYLGSPITGGMVNELNNNITALKNPGGYITTGLVYSDCSHTSGGYCVVLDKVVVLNIRITVSVASNYTKKYITIPSGKRPNTALMGLLAENVSDDNDPIYCVVNESGEIYLKGTTANKPYSISGVWITA